MAVAGLLIYVRVDQFRAAVAWAEAEAEADRLDPGWRWDDLEAKRAAVPDDRNAALLIHRLNSQWPYVGAIRGWPAMSPTRGMPATYVAQLRAAIESSAPLLAEAYRLADFDSGRFPDDRRNQPRPLMSHSLEATNTTIWLRAAALVRMEDHDVDGALSAIQAIVSCARAIGDEPLGQYNRVSVRSDLLWVIERLLTQGEPRADGLAALQARLEADEPDNPWLQYLRGLRAVSFLDRDRSSTWQLFQTFLRKRRLPAWSVHVSHFRAQTAYIEALKQPEPERSAQVTALKSKYPGINDQEHAFRRDRAFLRCVIAALAAERYRQEKGHWPESVAELVSAGLIRTGMEDPFDGQPLRLKRSANGLVIYTVGDDRTDNGGRLRPEHIAPPGYDLGLTLWDADVRRQ
jgi:hypothetical protein